MRGKLEVVISKVLVSAILVTSIFSNTNGIKVFASDTPLRKIDVWDFGGVQAVGNIYNNNITASILDTKPTLQNKSFMTTTFGDLSIGNPDLSDRMYYYESDGTTAGKYNYGTSVWGNAVHTYSDGYAADGCYYCNGSAGTTRRFLTINNVTVGDKISVYGATSNGDETIHFVHASIATSNGKMAVTPDASKTQDSTAAYTTTLQRVDFVAQYSGAYQIYVTATKGKPYFQRVVRTPGISVNGKVNLNGKAITDITSNKTDAGLGIKFVNQTTNDSTIVNVKTDGSFTTLLASGCKYIAVLNGASNVFKISDGNKVVSTQDYSIGNIQNIDTLNVVDNLLSKISGNIKGIGSDYDVSKLKITLTPPAASLSDSVTATIDTKTMTYSATVEQSLQYTVTVSGVNDYDLTAHSDVNIKTDTVEDITFTKKPLYIASGKFLKLSPTAKVQSIKFVNVDDGYTYIGTVTSTGYTVSLRNGAYSVTTVCSENYNTTTHVVVNGQNATKDLLFDGSNSTSQISRVSDLYVGDNSKPNNYATVKDAIDAAAKMNPTSEEQRITIHIVPGIYRAQLKISTPYITLVNSDPSKEVKITWYYGFGYQYYSVGSDGFYSADNAYDKYAKGNVSNGDWGGSVYVTSSATSFRAENIVFENSFNKYVTQEELDDGIEICKNFPQSVSGTLKPRTSTSDDVTSKVQTERASAMIIEADKTEFNNCRFIGSQDTLYTGSAGTVRTFFQNCLIEGNTDYIFGDGNSVFNGCILNFCGYSDTAASGYITAAKDTAAYGYLFNNCTVTANNNNKQAPGFFGRPWGVGARVTFMNTKLQTSVTIDPAGWTDMSGKPENAHYAEYNTTCAGTVVDTSSRRVHALNDTASIPNINSYLGDWAPKYNMDAGEIDGFTVKSTFNMTSLQPNTFLDTKTTITNNMKSIQPILLIEALYDGSGKMINLSYTSKNISIGDSENVNLGLQLPADVANCKVKVFVWNGTNLNTTTMQALSNVVTLQ